MKRRGILCLALGATALAAIPAVAAAAVPQVEVFKSRYCECCSAWVDHMKAAGFDMKVSVVNDTTAVRKRLGMPDRFGSYHSATVGNYVLEGHVPAVEVKKLLAAKPAAVGLAVPGMPPGSAGMEVGTRRDPYEVSLIDTSGHETVFASYPTA
jgi:hypothetical protein